MIACTLQQQTVEYLPVMQIAVSLLNDFALVYLLAPTPDCSVLTRGTKLGMLRAKLSDLPAHVFQQAPGGILG